ncbi:integrase [Bifidobacterium pseudolongum subsp. globosum]|uniref:IS21 family transposase n=1 Tax=Bifidobacterium pseudolongum TaxID=1694 RepID=UPI0010228B03|nr:IS21 family transposase [Bifidobacterium pseudolongum]RYQ40904.1 integrase [Bifidobacterium pseudolongum subsp. globosum]
MAIPMPIQQDIRRRDRQGVPHARIARELGVDRGTVAKYARQEDCSPRPRKDRRYGRKTDAFEHVIDRWLEADRMMPRKQRHTAKRVYDRLVAEHGFDGSYSGVRRYVKAWRETNREASDGYLRLEWDPGVMQVDFGVALADVAGRERSVHFLVALLPYSNMRYAVAMPGENAECLCAGLSMVFERMGGVPAVLIMDNATGAGRRDRNGEVTLTHVFAAFVSHHRMEVRFCNPYSGNEKGSVENAVGYLRRNLMVPKPAAESFEQLSRLLLERCEELARSCPSPADPAMSVAERFGRDRDELMALPSMPFDAVSWHTRKSDKYGRVQFGSSHYHAGGGRARANVLVAARWDSVTLHDPDTDAVIADYPRAYGATATMRDPALVVHQLAAKPRAWGESEIRADLPALVRRWLDSRDPDDLAASLRAISAACREASFDAVAKAAAGLIETHEPERLHAHQLTPTARRLDQGERMPDTDQPDLSHYDLFLGHDER